MLTPKIQQLGTLPTAHGRWLAGTHCSRGTRACACAACGRRQRAEVARPPRDSAQATGRTF